MTLEDELRDAWKGEGNSKRITFLRWVKNMADNRTGTLQVAATLFLRQRRSEIRIRREASY